jgi:hypothetical protein
MLASLIAIFLVTVAFGVAGVIGASQRTSLVQSVRSASGPLALDAQLLYRSLSDADATAGGEFLYASGRNPDPTALATLRSRYLTDIDTASANLTAVSASRSDTAALRELSAGIPTYTGLVETARADSRLGLPLGAAYLREASSQMRSVLLPAANSLYLAETKQLAADRGSAGGFPWIAIPLGLIALIVLIRAQRALARRTHRMFSPPLVLASLAVVIALGWIVVSWSGDAIHLHDSAENGSRPTELLANARIDVLSARADEELTLIARGNDPRFDRDFTTMMTAVRSKGGLLDRASSASASPGVRADISAARNDLATWVQQDTKMRATNAVGGYAEAVTDTVGSASGNAPALFAAVDADLGRAIDASNAEFQAQSTDAAQALAGLAIAVAVLIVISLAGLILGFQRRIAEYR